MQDAETIADQVEAVLNVLRPSMSIDRGGVRVESTDGGHIKLRMLGTCHRCPKSAMTFADIVKTLRQYVPDISEIERIDE
jgi:Fe-S cluster biogenesis protein NfuA